MFYAPVAYVRVAVAGQKKLVSSPFVVVVVVVVVVLFFLVGLDFFGHCID